VRRLTGKVVIVTGASQGLGEATARAFHAAGATVVITARRTEPIQALAAELGTGPAIAGDVTDEADRVRLVEATVDSHARIDVLVNNAGITWAGPPGTEPADVSSRVLDTNLLAVLRLCHLVAPVMADHDGGAIVNVSSISALRSFDRFGLSAYAASKAGVHGLTRELAAQWGRSGVRVNAVAPGFFPGGTTGYLRDESVRDWVSDHTALGRPGRPEELAAAILFLASEDAAYVTGQVLAVDGGWTTH
jgi:hypothetical protein